MKISFRLRITFISLFVSGIALAAFSGFSWWKISDAKINKINSQLNGMLIGMTRELIDGHLSIETNKIAHALGKIDANAIWVLAITHDQIINNSLLLSDTQINSLPWPLMERFSMAAQPPSNPPNRPQLDGPPPKVIFTELSLADRHWHTGLVTTPFSRLAIGVDSSIVDAEMALITRSFLIAIPLTLLLVGIAAWMLSTKALRPIYNLTDAMQSLSTQQLKERVDINAGDKEFIELISVFNQLLSRLEASFNQAIRFSGDAAHELKTPLAIIQGQLERAIQETPAGSDIQKNLSQALDEARRITAICRKLLLLSQADAGKLQLHREPFNLSQALMDTAEDAHMMAPSLKITCDMLQHITIYADSILLRQALQNLITNAVKYNIENGWVVITCKKSTDHVVVEIKNSSSGLSTAAQQHLFERFYRGDTSHNRQIEGTGLGLSLAQEIIKAHGGLIVLSTNTKCETGFTITFRQ